MGRSVSRPYDTIACTYQSVDWIQEEEDWKDYCFSLKEKGKAAFPSMRDCAKWLGNEDKAILENEFCYIGISEYCGLACIWLAPNTNIDDNRIGLQNKWIDSIIPKFNKIYGELRKLGTFSNGESIYERINDHECME